MMSRLSLVAPTSPAGLGDELAVAEYGKAKVNPFAHCNATVGIATRFLADGRVIN
jgi:hypothetical protein